MARKNVLDDALDFEQSEATAKKMLKPEEK